GDVALAAAPDAEVAGPASRPPLRLGGDEHEAVQAEEPVAALPARANVGNPRVGGGAIDTVADGGVAAEREHAGAERVRVVARLEQGKRLGMGRRQAGVGEEAIQL